MRESPFSSFRPFEFQVRGNLIILDPDETTVINNHLAKRGTFVTDAALTSSSDQGDIYMAVDVAALSGQFNDLLTKAASQDHTSDSQTSHPAKI